MDKEKLKEDLEKWEREIARDPENAEAYFNRGNRLYDLGRKEEALKSYNRALIINPNDSKGKAYCNRGIILAELGRKEKALVSYNRALGINPNDDTTYCNRGNVLAELGRQKEAQDSYNKALKINTENYVAYCNLGNVLNCLGRQEEALNSYNKALEINTEYNIAYFNRGNVLADLGRQEEALVSYDKALEINPNDDTTYCNRGNVLADLGRKMEALSSYDKALEINPDDDGSWNNKGILLSYFGRKEEALACYIKAIQINANHENAKLNRRALIGSDLFWDSLSEASQPDLWSGDEDFNTLASREKLKDCSGKDLQCIRHLWMEQYRLLHLLSADLEQVGHYTSSSVFETLLKEQKETKGKANPLLLCSLAAANDPTEGTVFQSLLGEDCMPSQRIRSNLAVLQTSFSSTIDSLNQFRLYGKSKGEEGTGLCLVFSRSFFASPGETSMITVRRDHEQSSEKEPETCRKLPLYWVLYYDRDSGQVYYTPACTEHSLNKNFEMEETSLEEFDRKKVQDIGKSLKRIQDIFKAIDKKYQQTALEMLIYLRHLVKDAAFKDEKELRILSLHPYNDPSLKVLPGKNCLSVDYLPVIDGEEEYLEKVIAGPKLRDFANLVDVARFRLHHLGGKKEVEFCQSQAPLN